MEPAMDDPSFILSRAWCPTVRAFRLARTSAPLLVRDFSWETPMLKVSEYLTHADECDRLAGITISPQHRATLRQMAQTWRDLAGARRLELKAYEQDTKRDRPS
jgi:hypothetical protein